MCSAKRRQDMKIKDSFKERATGFWLTFGAACLAFVGALLYVIVDSADRTFSVIGFVFMLAGALSVLLTVFTDWKWTPAVPALLYVVGFAFTLHAMLPSLSDVWNGVNFIGGNAMAGLTFSIIFFVACIAAAVACFLE